MAETYGLTSENKAAVDTALDFPKLKLKKGEVARVAIFGITEKDGKRSITVPSPEGGYYFDLRNPFAGENERDYLGSFECIASEETKRADEYDGDACPHCALVLQGNVSSEVVGPRKRRNVMPVVRYKTKTRSSELVKPYSVEVLAWRFSGKYFNQLVDENERWADPEGANNGLLKHDLVFTCEVEKYQNYLISVMPNSAYAEDKELAKLVLETYLGQTEELTNGLARVLGTTLNSADLERKLNEVMMITQSGMSDAESFAKPSVDAETISNMAADLLGESQDETSVEATDAESPEEEAEAVSVAAAPTGDSLDLDEFFN